MTRDTLPGWPVSLAGGLFFDVTAPAEFVKLRFDQRVDLWIGFVTFETLAAAGIVDEFMVAAGAIHALVISMCKGHWQQLSVCACMLLKLMYRPDDASAEQTGKHPAQCFQAPQLRDFSPPHIQWPAVC